jgi:hypothetical protein
MSNYEEKMMEQMTQAINTITHPAKPVQPVNVATVTMPLEQYQLLWEFRKIARSYYVRCECFTEGEHKCSICTRYLEIRDADIKNLVP